MKLEPYKVAYALAKDIAKKFHVYPSIDEYDHGNSYTAKVGGLGKRFISKERLLGIMKELLSVYEYSFGFDAVQSLKCTDDESLVKLDASTEVSSFIHFGGMLYDESYAKNKNTGNSCIVSITESIDENKDDLVCVLIYVTVTSAE